MLAMLATTASAQTPITTSDDLFQNALAKPRERILLVPLDDRPATTQFAQMIGAIANVEVDTPPAKFLGRFTEPGNPDRILGWMSGLDLSKYQSVIVNNEMIAYGGLIASRTNSTSYADAIRRLRTLWGIRKRVPDTRFYVFSAIQRIAPTALKTNQGWREALTDLVALKSKIGASPTPDDIKRAASLRSRIPAGAVDAYYATRQRNHLVQQEVLRMVSAKAFDFLILGQDDAQPVGPHTGETRRLTDMAANLKIADRVHFCEGIDQHANVLVSRSLLSEQNWTPSVRVVFADEIGKGKIAPFESDHVENSLIDQLVASGARVADKNEDSDYTLYVNTPAPREEHFTQFVSDLKSDVDQGFPVAVADINLGQNGTGDPRLFDALQEQSRSMRLLAYAGWNTAGNTMGTAIPASNIYLLARRLGTDDLERELSQREFLLHRLVNDFEYHRYTRPQAYQLQRNLGMEKEETYGPSFDVLNQFVQKDMASRLQETFQNQFKGRRFFAGTRQYEMSTISDVDVELPWPRAYEVRIGFRLGVTEVK